MRSTLGGLDVVTVQATPRVPPTGVVVLCHGFGAPGTDLVGLARALVSVEPSLATARFHFPSGLPFSKLVLGGFSQGAMITTDVALRLEEAPAGLVALSGTLLVEDAWRQKASARKGLPVFQSHGRFDGVLPFTAATWLEAMLRDAGLGVEFHAFDGGHEIPEDILVALAGFLARRLAP